MNARQKSTTAYPILFLLVSSADHITAVTGAAPTVTISKNGGAFASPSGAVTEVGNGIYSLAGNATDRNTLGTLAIHATATGADAVDMLIDIVDYNPFVFGANLDAAVSTVKTKTDLIPADPATETTLAALPAAVWAAATRTLSSFGTLVADTAGAVRNLLTGVTVTVSSPVTTTGTITLYVGDDYQNIDGRAISWTIPALTTTVGATGLFVGGGLNKALTVVDTTTVRMELTHTETALLTAGAFDYRMSVADADGHVATLVTGTLIVR